MENLLVGSVSSWSPTTAPSPPARQAYWYTGGVGGFAYPPRSDAGPPLAGCQPIRHGRLPTLPKRGRHCPAMRRHPAGSQRRCRPLTLRLPGHCHRRSRAATAGLSDWMCHVDTEVLGLVEPADVHLVQMPARPESRDRLIFRPQVKLTPALVQQPSSRGAPPPSSWCRNTRSEWITASSSRTWGR